MERYVTKFMFRRCRRHFTKQTFKNARNCVYQRPHLEHALFPRTWNIQISKVGFLCQDVDVDVECEDGRAGYDFPGSMQTESVRHSTTQISL
jgi:hypothetical protein